MRLVSLTCSNTEIVAALGLGSQLVGVDDHSDWPPDVVDAAVRLGPDLQIDLDRVEALSPDLVLASLTVPGHERIVEELVRRGIPHLAPEPQFLGDVARDVRAIARALGVMERGEELSEELERAFVVQPVDDPPRIVVEWWPRPVFVPGARSWVTGLTEAAGGINPFSDRDCKSFPLSTEEANDAGIEAIVISWCGVPTAKYRPSLVTARPGYEAIPAVRAGRVFSVPEAFLGRPGPRLVQGLEALRGVVAAVRTSREII